MTGQLEYRQEVVPIEQGATAANGLAAEGWEAFAVLGPLAAGVSALDPNPRPCLLMLFRRPVPALVGANGRITHAGE